MKKYLMVVANYPDYRQEFFEKHMSPRNKGYCKLHGFEYLEYLGPQKSFRDHPTWWKFTIVRDLINDGTLKEGDILTHIDADMCIHKLDVPYLPNKSFTYCIDSGNTHCMGSYSILVNDWTKNMIDLVLDENRYQNLKDKITLHEYFGHHDSFWSIFREQASWYSLAGIKRHSNIPFYNLAHYGWHSAKDEWTVYSLPELYKHVEILPTSWNVTEMPGESGCEFNINNVERSDVIIRHFAGGQPWRAEWFNQ
jgi:hypothetical protein